MALGGVSAVTLNEALAACLAAEFASTAPGLAAGGSPRPAPATALKPFATPWAIRSDGDSDIFCLASDAILFTKPRGKFGTSRSKNWFTPRLN